MAIACVVEVVVVVANIVLGVDDFDPEDLFATEVVGDEEPDDPQAERATPSATTVPRMPLTLLKFI